MIDQLPTLMKLLKSLQQVPYLASKNLYRVADHFLNMSDEQRKQFCAILALAGERLIRCSVCSCWQEREDSCLFCSASGRNQQLVCVVENWQELLAIEQTRGYSGVYHVLNGLICPLNGIGPENLTIDQLLARVEAGTIAEIIFAISQTPEGEATTAYIATKLKAAQIKVTCLARGLPVGSTLGTMDRLTVFKALSERRLY